MWSFSSCHHLIAVNSLLEFKSSGPVVWWCGSMPRWRQRQLCFGMCFLHLHSRGHLEEERVVQTLCVHTSISLEYTSHFISFLCHAIVCVQCVTSIAPLTSNVPCSSNTVVYSLSMMRYQRQWTGSRMQQQRCACLTSEGWLTGIMRQAGATTS